MAKGTSTVKEQSIYDAQALGLTTPEDLQKNIQSIYSNVKKIVQSQKDKQLQRAFIGAKSGFEIIISDTKDIKGYTYQQVLTFWYKAVKINKVLTDLSNTK